MIPFRELLKQETEVANKIEGMLRNFEATPSKIPSMTEQAEFDRLMNELPKINKKMLNHVHFVHYVTKVPH
jgi:hypothetical protein